MAETQKRLYFANDYGQGCHPRVLERLAETNLTPQPGYGGDDYCAAARGRLRDLCRCPEAEVFFLSGGTQTNRVVISALLRPWEGVLAAETGHVAVHEAGAIESAGHKVLSLPAHQGKLDAAETEAYLRSFYADGNHDHMVFPGMVYISWPTELGTLYTRAELTALRALCDRWGIPLYLDGARLGCGLASRDCDLSLPEIAALCDVFYLGGTKQGALLGEALIFPRSRVPDHFVTLVKQQGALLAKGRAIGVQFEALLEDGLYFELGQNAVDRAEELKAVLRREGWRFYLESPTNQQFLIVPDELLEPLGERVAFSFWENYDETHSVIRLCTSWATTREDVEELGRVLKEI